MDKRNNENDRRSGESKDFPIDISKSDDCPEHVMEERRESNRRSDASEQHYDYLDGLIGDIYDDGDLPDGAWMQMMIDTVEADGFALSVDGDGHDCVMDYIKYRSEKLKDINIIFEDSDDTPATKHNSIPDHEWGVALKILAEQIELMVPHVELTFVDSGDERGTIGKLKLTNTIDGKERGCEFGFVPHMLTREQLYDGIGAIAKEAAGSLFYQFTLEQIAKVIAEQQVALMTKEVEGGHS